jgi:D-alanyl-D-alanine carboxypeptidase
MTSRTHALRLRAAALVGGLLLCFGLVGPAFADKYASIVVDMDSARVLHERNADEPRYPASLTKVMTLYMVFDALEDGRLKTTDRLSVSRAAAVQQPSKLGLRSGSTIRVEDAIRALVTKSANDVAVVFAEALGGSEKKFAVMMTERARELGLDNTVFTNASGLPDKRQMSTARDLARLAEAMYFDHRDHYAYFSTPQFTWKKRRYQNHNTLLSRVEGVDGIKTGFTNASGYNLMASAEREGHRVIAIMLGGATGRSRDQHVSDLLEAAFLDIEGGASDRIADLRDRIRAGELANASADDLAAMQLRRFAEADAALGPGPDAGQVEGVETTEEGDSASDLSEEGETIENEASEEDGSAESEES